MGLTQAAIENRIQAISDTRDESEKSRLWDVLRNRCRLPILVEDGVFALDPVGFAHGQCSECAC